jgi:hypothetical protein
MMEMVGYNDQDCVYTIVDVAILSLDHNVSAEEVGDCLSFVSLDINYRRDFDLVEHVFKA